MAHGAFFGVVPHDEIGIASNRQGSLPGIHSEEPCRIGGYQPYELGDRDPPSCDPFGEEQRHAQFNPR